LILGAKTLDVKIWVIFVYKWEGYRSRFEEAMLRKLAFQNPSSGPSLPIAFFKT